MDALATLRSKIPGFPGYGDADARRLCDEEVRAYLGEALAALGTRLGSVGALSERYESTLLRAEFINQSAFRVFELADLDDAHIAAMAAADLAVLELADRAGAVDASSLGAYLDSINAAIDERERLMKTSSSTLT